MHKYKKVKGLFMEHKILVVEKIHQAGMDILASCGDVVIAPDTSEATIVSMIGDCDGLLTRSSKITAPMIEAGKNLKVIGRHGIGVDTIDVDCATRCGVKVCNTPTANVISVAEQVIADMMYFSKEAHKCDKAMRDGVFCQQGSLPALVTRLGYNTLELYGKTVGFIGMGKIARRAAHICVEGFGMKAFGYDPYLTDEQIASAGAEPRHTVEELVTGVDFVSIHVPLLPTTKNLLDYEMIKKMKPNAVLINTARGGIINEEDLCRAIDEGLIAGAAVDVYASEPPAKDHPFFSRSKILCTPHVAAMTDGALYRMAVDSAQAVKDVLEGREPASCVNKKALEEKQ